MRSASLTIVSRHLICSKKSKAKMADESPKGNEGKLLKLPLARIKMIMKSSPDLGSVNQEGYFLIARAAVCFAACIKYLCHLA